MQALILFLADMWPFGIAENWFGWCFGNYIYEGQIFLMNFLEFFCSKSDQASIYKKEIFVCLARPLRFENEEKQKLKLFKKSPKLWGLVS